ncbi:MAG: helix-turn-helix domain-containing protein [Propionibacteriales bacterium]|nr:helix-turn-helix domain-containing protein [Propionibacteriales bacterium]
MAKIGYARVSTRSQHDTSQIDALTVAGCTRIFRDVASGKLARRPDWDACLDYLRAGDQLVVTRLSRMARSVQHLTEVAALMGKRGVDLIVLEQSLNTTTSTGRLLFHIIGALDEFTADLISEGTLEGLAAARARGRIGGRPTVMTPHKLTTARRLLDEGETITEAARTVGVGRTTLYRHLELGERPLNAPQPQT